MFRSRSAEECNRCRRPATVRYLAYVGLWGLGYDFAKDTLEAGKDLIDRAELRGEEMVRELNTQLETYTNQASRRGEEGHRGCHGGCQQSG